MSFEPRITVQDSTLAEMGRKIMELEAINAELLTTLKLWVAPYDEYMATTNILEQSRTAIAKAEGRELNSNEDTLGEDYEEGSSFFIPPPRTSKHIDT